MNLKVFGSSSKGNGYALTDNDGNTLLIECGVPVSKIKQYLNFRMEGIVGCLVSHVHGDHSKYVKQYISAGIDVAMSIETATAMGLETHHRIKIIEEKRKYSSLLDEFTVLPISMKHDVHCFGFVIQHKEMGNTVFITDSYYSPYRFANIHNWIIECNYQQEILDQNNSGAPSFLRERIMKSHLSLDHLLQMFEANDMTKTNSIVLTHLSDTNSHAVNFQKKVKQATAKTVFIAEPGLSINLNKTPF